MERLKKESAGCCFAFDSKQENPSTEGVLAGDFAKFTVLSRKALQHSFEVLALKRGDCMARAVRNPLQADVTFCADPRLGFISCRFLENTRSFCPLGWVSKSSNSTIDSWKHVFLDLPGNREEWLSC